MTGRKISETYVNELLEWCEGNNTGLVIMDSLVRMHDGEENSARDIAKIFGLMRRLTSAGITLLIAHHNRKPGANGDGGSEQMRGSSDILAAIDCHIAVRRPRKDEYLTMEQTKNRYATEIDPIELSFKEHVDYSEFLFLGQNERKDKSQNLVLKIINILEAEHGLNQTVLLQRLDDEGAKTNAKTLRKYLERMEQEGSLIVKPGERNARHYFASDKHIAPEGSRVKVESLI
jgi:predicted transcriptional regulator